MKILDNISMNEYGIKLVDEKQVSYGFIYTLSPMELEILKTYIETYHKTRFIWFPKSSVNTSIFFDKKPESSFSLYVDYWDLNNPTSKNWYPLFLISKFLDSFRQVKQFI